MLIRWAVYRAKWSALVKRASHILARKPASVPTGSLVAQRFSMPSEAQGLAEGLAEPLAPLSSTLPVLGSTPATGGDGLRRDLADLVQDMAGFLRSLVQLNCPVCGRGGPARPSRWPQAPGE